MEGQARPTIKLWKLIFTPAFVAAVASLIPSLIVAGWKLISPGYNCALRGSVFDSPCIAVQWVAALALGWLAGLMAVRLGRRGAGEPEAAERMQRAEMIGRLMAGVVGLLVGIPFAGYVLNPCP